jgi:hypothetical protein
MQKSFSLFRWPLDICVFELALGYGVSRVLKMWFEPGSVPSLVYLGAYAVVALVSAWVVCRHMPSSWAIAWTWLSLTLAAGIPVIGVIYAETLLFWVATVLIGAMKALYSLEEHRRKENPALGFDERPSTVPGKGWLRRFVYSPQPMAFALQPAATAVLLTATSVGLVMQFRFLIGGPLTTLPVILGLIGQVVSGASIWLYVDLSAKSRVEAIKRERSQAA